MIRSEYRVTCFANLRAHLRKRSNRFGSRARDVHNVHVYVYAHEGPNVIGTDT